MNHAVAQLRLAAEIAENNFPINMREGKYAQARLEREVSRDCRRAMSALEQVKLASFLSAKPKATDYARIGGRTALEGGLGGYGGSALMALLAGLISKKVPGSIGAKGIGAMIGAGGGAGAVAGGLHGFSKAKGNAKARLGPIGQLKRLAGL